MVEIDKMVIDACIEHMPSVNAGGAIYKDLRAELIVADAAEYVKNTSQRFDVVIVDSTDPVGPGEKIFTPEFYRNLARILSDEAYISTQGGVAFFQKGEVAFTLDALKKAGLSTDCFIAAIPT
jgi:spermidine synthase